MPLEKKRTDIQALRGLAILLVLLHHAQAPYLSGGYLGVDIFFVISGYLITGLVKERIERNEFSFNEFYFRRAKRLLPAAYVTFLACALLAPLILGSTELADFSAQLVGAITFTGNVVLWQQTGYFEGTSELKPLLHVWSLAIEEQYYFILPAAMALIAPRRWLPAALAVLIASLALCLLGGYFKPVATFYLLPFRGWELALGSIGALLRRDSWLDQASHAVFIPALMVLVAIPTVPIGGNHPGLDALLVCVATLVVIRCQHEPLNASTPARALARIGDFSYSLYLVHWPIFAFLNNAWIGGNPVELPAGVRAAAVAASLALGYALYRLVEHPVHASTLRLSWRLVSTSVGASVGLLMLTGGVAGSAVSGTDIANPRRPNLGFGETCVSGGTFVPTPECRNADRPTILVWGDSFAMHLVPGLAATSGESGVIQATRYQCGPLLDVAPIGRPGSRHVALTRNWGEECIAFNQSVVDYLAAAPWVETVVLSSPLEQYLNSPDHLILQKRGDERVILDTGSAETLAGLQRTVLAIRALGRKVVLVGPPPTARFDIGACRERLTDGKLSLGAPSDCQISLGAYRERNEELLEFVSMLPSALYLPVLRLEPALCNSTTCTTAMGSTPLYNDSAHLSYEGSRLIAERLNLGPALQELAR